MEKENARSRGQIWKRAENVLHVSFATDSVPALSPQIQQQPGLGGNLTAADVLAWHRVCDRCGCRYETAPWSPAASNVCAWCWLVGKAGA